jgi:HlyD family secretion protein
MQIDSSFAEADIANIKPGQETNFTVDAFPNRSFKGTVKEIRLNPTTQQNVVTYDVVILVDNTDGTLLPGMTAYVNIKTAEHKNVVLVPNTALRYRPKTTKIENTNTKIVAGTGVIYRLIKGKPKSVICSLGISDSRNTEVHSCDLKAGDEVVIGDAVEDQGSSSSSLRMRVF